MHRIQAIDSIEGFPGESGADWYYHVGLYQDDNFLWQHSPEPVGTNNNDLIIDKIHTFYTIQSNVSIAIMVCEDDFWSYDDLADISSDESGGLDNVASSIQPQSDGLWGGTYLGFYDITNSTLSNDIYIIDGGYYKTSGNYEVN